MYRFNKSIDFIELFDSIAIHTAVKLFLNKYLLYFYLFIYRNNIYQIFVYYLKK